MSLKAEPDAEQPSSMSSLISSAFAYDLAGFLTALYAIDATKGQSQESTTSSAVARSIPTTRRRERLAALQQNGAPGVPTPSSSCGRAWTDDLEHEAGIARSDVRPHRTLLSTGEKITLHTCEEVLLFVDRLPDR